MKKKRYLCAVAALLLGLIAAFLRLANTRNSSNSQAIDTQQQSARHNSDIPPLQIGARRLAFQFGTLLPQVHLTLRSVLQGVALGILVQQLEIQLLSIVLFASSVAVAIAIWYMYANAFVVFLWPLHIVHTSLHFLLLTAEVFAFLNLSTPTLWLVGLSITAFLGAFIRWLNPRIITERTYEKPEIFQIDRENEGRAASHLLITGLIVFLLALIYNIISLFFPDWLEIGGISIGILVGVMAIILMIQVEKENELLIQTLLEGSPWVYRNHLIIKRESREHTKEV